MKHPHPMQCAVHESAHAIVAIAHGEAMYGLELFDEVRDDGQAAAMRGTHLDLSLFADEAFREHPIVRADVLREIAIRSAGGFAEIRFRNEHRTGIAPGDDDDRRRAWDLARAAAAGDVRRASVIRDDGQRMGARTVATHWSAILRLAVVLLERGTVSGNDARSIFAGAI